MHGKCTHHTPRRTQMCCLSLGHHRGNTRERRGRFLSSDERLTPPMLPPSLLITKWVFLVLMGFPLLAHACVLDKYVSSETSMFHLKCQLHSTGGENLKHCVEGDPEASSDSEGVCPRSISDVCLGLEGAGYLRPLAM